MASKSAWSDAEKGAEIEELLDDLEKRVDRLRVMYEQYFMGIMKQAPSHLHSEAERRIRDITQLQIRNTGLRYRFATITQKFGAYNTYWRRTLREIEAGRYVRDLSRIRRKALAVGEEIPEEIVAAMPKRMREMVQRDRAAAQAQAARRGQGVADAEAGAGATGAPADGDGEGDEPAVVHAPKPAGRQTYTLDMDADLDVDQLFDDITGVGQEAPAPAAASAVTTSAAKPAAPAAGAPAAAPKLATTPPPLPSSVPRPPAVPPPRPGATAAPAAAGKPTTIAPPRAASDTIPTPMAEFPPFEEDAPTGLRRPSDTLAPPTPMPAPRVAPTPAPKPAAAIRPPTGVIPPIAARPAPPREAPTPAPPPREAPTPVPAAREPAPKPAARVAPLEPPPGMSDADTRALYTKFLKARQLVGENNDDMTYDRLLRTLRQQGSKIIEQYKARGVEFGVVIKDNKVILKAKPKG